MEGLRQDLRYALRTLRRSPGFAAIAVLTLGLGIGATVAIFSVVHGVLLRPLPFPESDRLVRIWQTNPGESIERGAISPVDFEDWYESRQAFAEMGAFLFDREMGGLDLTSEGEPERLAAAWVTRGFFPTLQVQPQLGRLPRPEEMERGNDRFVMLSHGLWQRRFGGDPGIIGRSVVLDGVGHEVIGVMPRTFDYPSPDADVWMSLSGIPDDAIPRHRMVRFLAAIGRLQPGATVEQARAELAVMSQRLAEEYPESNRNWSAATVLPLREAMVGDVRPALLVLLGAVGFVLLIVCANLANLLLSRASGREREFAIRAALGAGRGRVVRQLLTESVVLSLIGGVVGVLLALWGVAALRSLSAVQLPRLADVRVDLAVLAFTFGVAVVTGVLFGLAPALKAASPRLQERLRSGGHGTAGGGRGQRLRSGLVVAEVALAVVLIAGAGLMLRTLGNLVRVDPGFNPENVLVVSFTIPPSAYEEFPEIGTYYQQVLEQVRAVPGVESAGAIKTLPLRGTGENARFFPSDRRPARPEDAPSAMLLHVSTDYFRTLGIPLRRGRAFTEADRFDAPPVVMINEAMARRYWPDQDPTLHSIDMGGGPMQIVGVVGDVRQGNIGEPPEPALYRHTLQNPRVGVNLVVRTRGEPLRLTDAVQDAIRTVNPNQTITGITTLGQVVRESVARPRLLTTLLGFFGGFGLVLGALGIYGVLAYAVSQQRKEIGVRMALGASPRRVLRMVVGRGMTLTLIGIVLGVAGALLLTRYMSSVLYGVSPGDPLALAGGALLLAAVALLAAYFPARRATRVDPMVALRAE